MLPRNLQEIDIVKHVTFAAEISQITAGDCDEKSSHAGHNLAIKFQKAAELRFLVFSCNQLISNLN